jgi:hypothetical protein
MSGSSIGESIEETTSKERAYTGRHNLMSENIGGLGGLPRSTGACRRGRGVILSNRRSANRRPIPFGMICNKNETCGRTCPSPFPQLWKKRREKRLYK